MLLPTDDPPGYTPGEVKLSKNLIGSAKGKFVTTNKDAEEPSLDYTDFLFWTFFLFFSSDAILNMVNNIAVNVLGGGPEMQGMTSTTCGPVFSVFQQEILLLSHVILTRCTLLAVLFFLFCRKHFITGSKRD